MGLTPIDQYKSMGIQPGPFSGEMAYPAATFALQRGQGNVLSKNPNVGMLHPALGIGAAVMEGLDQAAKNKAEKFLQKEAEAQKSRADFYREAMLRAQDPGLTETARQRIYEETEKVLRSHTQELTKAIPKGKGGPGEVVRNIFSQLTGGDMTPAEKIDPNEVFGQITSIASHPYARRSNVIKGANEALAERISQWKTQNPNDILTSEKVREKALEVSTAMNLAGTLGPEDEAQWLQRAPFTTEAYPYASPQYGLQKLDQFDREIDAQRTAAAPSPAQVAGIAAPEPETEAPAAPLSLSQQYLNMVQPAESFVETGPPGPRPETGPGSVYAPTAVAPGPAGVMGQAAPTPTVQPAYDPYVGPQHYAWLGRNKMLDPTEVWVMPKGGTQKDAFQVRIAAGAGGNLDGYWRVDNGLKVTPESVVQVSKEDMAAARNAQLVRGYYTTTEGKKIPVTQKLDPTTGKTVDIPYGNLPYTERDEYTMWGVPPGETEPTLIGAGQGRQGGVTRPTPQETKQQQDQRAGVQASVDVSKQAEHPATLSAGGAPVTIFNPRIAQELLKQRQGSMTPEAYEAARQDIVARQREQEARPIYKGTLSQRRLNTAIDAGFQTWQQQQKQAAMTPEQKAIEDRIKRMDKR